MAKLNRIIYLSEEQKEELFANDTITVNGVTIDYNENDLYVTPDIGESFTEEDPVFLASPAANISTTDISNWNAKSNFSGSYNDLTNKPTIPAAQVNSDWNAASGIAQILNKPNIPSWALASTKPTYTANEVGAITSSEANNLIASAIGDINSFEIEIVNSLPVSNIDTNTIYFVPKTGVTNDAYDEYMYINNTWEMIGNTIIDLNGYLRTTDIADWAKASTKPTYTASEVGALPSTTTIPTATSDLTNDSGYLTSYTETDPVFAASAAAGISSSDITTWNNKSNLWTVSGTYNAEYEWWNLELNRTALLALSQAPGSGATIYDIKIPTGRTTYLTLRNPYYYQNRDRTFTFPMNSGTLALTSDIPSVPSWALESTKPSYTAAEVGALPNTTSIPSKTSDLTNDSGFITDAGVTSFNGSTGAVTYTAPVTSVNGQTGAVTLSIPSSASDVGALADDSVAAGITSTDISNWNAKLSSFTETDPTVPAWAKASSKPSYTASEVGALPSTTTYVSSFNGSTGAITYTAPVTSVNGQTGAVTLSIPAAQVQSDWNATSGMGVILNKPTIPAATTVTQTLTSGTAIGAVNGTTLYAPTAYDDTALANRVTALENIPWVTYYTGTSEPSSATGNNGDIYFQTDE